MGGRLVAIWVYVIGYFAVVDAVEDAVVALVVPPLLQPMEATRPMAIARVRSVFTASPFWKNV